MIARPLIVSTLAVVLAAAGQAASAQAFRCQYADGHVEFSQSTCPFGTTALNVARPDLKQAATPASAASAAVAVAPARATAATQAGQLDEPGPDGQPPVTWNLVDIDYRGVSVHTLFDKLAQLVGRKVSVDANVRDRVVAAHYHDVPWDEAVADIAARSGLDVRDDGKTLTVKKKR